MALFRAIGDEWWIGFPLWHLGIIRLEMRAYAAARAHLQESLAAFQHAGETFMTASTLATLGDMAHFENEHDRAVQLYEEALLLWQQLGSGPLIAATVLQLACSHAALGAWVTAEGEVREGLRLTQAVGSRSAIVG